MTENAIEGPDEATLTSPDYRPGPVKHIVLFRYDSSTTPIQRQEIEERFHALKASRRNGEPYIVSIESGSQNSYEGHDHGLEHGFIVTFRSEGDRNYYVGAPLIKNSQLFDTAHDEFKKFVTPHLAQGPTSVLVFDFTLAQPASSMTGISD